MTSRLGVGMGGLWRQRASRGRLLEAAVHGIGIALLPEPIVAAGIRTGLSAQVLPDWTATTHHIYLLYPSPRGMLPSVRSLIDYLLVHLRTSIQERSVDVEAMQRPCVSVPPEPPAVMGLG